MDEKRLVMIKHQTDRNRKFVCIMNDIEKCRFDSYENTLVKEQGDTSFRMCQVIQPMKVLLARRRSLQKCLQMRQRAFTRDHVSINYGRYGGLSLDDMRHDVDNYISTNHPRVRRIRHVQKLLSAGKKNGALLDYQSASEKIHSLFGKFEQQSTRLRLPRQLTRIAGNTPLSTKQGTTKLPPLRNTSGRRSISMSRQWSIPPTGSTSLKSTIPKEAHRHGLLPSLQVNK